jgi:hypothetical protein
LERALPLLRQWKFDIVSFGPSAHDENTFYVIRSYDDLADRQKREEAFLILRWRDWRGSNSRLRSGAYSLNGPVAGTSLRQTAEREVPEQAAAGARMRIGPATSESARKVRAGLRRGVAG